MREYEADILSAADGDDRPDGKCVHDMYLKYEVDARIAQLELIVGEHLLDIETAAAALSVTPLKPEEGTTARQLAIDNLRARAERVRLALQSTALHPEK